MAGVSTGSMPRVERRISGVLAEKSVGMVLWRTDIERMPLGRDSVGRARREGKRFRGGCDHGVRIKLQLYFVSLEN
jgi:hypothetical protein